MKNLIIRALSGAIYVVIILANIIGGDLTFTSIVGILALLGSVEMSRLSRNSNPNVMTVDIIFATALAITPYLTTYGIPLTQVIALLALFVIIRVIVAVFDKGENPSASIAKSFLSVMYIGIPLACLDLIYMLGDWGKWAVLAIFVVIWINDTGAYCVGCTLGKHRLCERLSPKKSWEGFWGGFVFSIGWGIACNYLFPQVGLNLYEWICFGAISSVFATWGDLFESMLKRNAGVKDSGNIIPGHGGILDRIDSLLLVSPVIMLFLLMV